MNILREIRRVKKRSMSTRIILILIFSVIFVINTYAWFSTQKDINLEGIHGDVTSWDVSYFVNNDTNEILDEIATFTIDELYPGMPDRQDIAHVYNRGTSSTNITFEVISVKIFGQEVVESLRTDGEIQSTVDENTGATTVNIFAKETQYPFNIGFTYDRAKLVGEYVDDTTTPRAHATCKFHVNWPYLGTGTEEQKEAKDILDTKFGKDAYAYYQDDANDPTKAIEIKVKIKSSMIHPKDDPEYVE